MTVLLRETFRQAPLDARLGWHCEPTHWSVETARGCLRLTPDADTDFWQRTHYGFRVDNGHFLGMPVAGDFQLTTHVRFGPAHQYDQAGLMVRLSEDCWLKTSVEYETDALSRLGVVVTNAGFSDWSTQDVASTVRDMWLSVRREGSDCVVMSSLDGSAWQQLRLAHLAASDGGGEVHAGLYACSPKEAGFWAEFDLLEIVADP